MADGVGEGALILGSWQRPWYVGHADMGHGRSALPPVAKRWGLLRLASQVTLVGSPSMRDCHVRKNSVRVFLSGAAFVGKPDILMGNLGRLGGGERGESELFLPKPGGGMSVGAQMRDKGSGVVVTLIEDKVEGCAESKAANSRLRPKS